MSEIIKRPRLELADNGFILSYEVYDDSSSGGSSTYDGEKYVCDKKLVFPLEKQDDALKQFIEYGRKAGLISGKATEEESE